MEKDIRDDVLMGYVVASADNVSPNVYISKLFKTAKEAEDFLKSEYDDIIENLLDYEEFEQKECLPWSYHILTGNNDYYYANVREVYRN